MIEVHMENIEEVEINKKNRKQYGVAMATIGIMALFLMAVFHAPFASVAMTPVADTFGYFDIKTPDLAYYYFLEHEDIVSAAIDAAKSTGGNIWSIISKYATELITPLQKIADWISEDLLSTILSELWKIITGDVIGLAEDIIVGTDLGEVFGSLIEYIVIVAGGAVTAEDVVAAFVCLAGVIWVIW